MSFELPISSFVFCHCLGIQIYVDCHVNQQIKVICITRFEMNVSSNFQFSIYLYNFSGTWVKINPFVDIYNKFRSLT